MKRKITTFIFGLLFLAGFGILIYPTVSNQWNTYRQQQLITTYDKAVSKLEPEDFDAAWDAAETFNNSFDHNNIFGDVFSTQSKLTDIRDTEYWKVLNIEGNGIMGYLSIPKINVKLSIYHGTSDEVLQTGVGHLNGTKLPIGGESTHSVLSAHRGLPSAKLFTDIDQMKKGDRFYLHILDENLAYEVDQILSMVDKDDHETLEKALQIESGQDYVTLFTCTPYGVNTHRLLVRGHRVPYEGEEIASTPVDTMVQAIQNYYMLFLLLGLAVTALVIVLMKHLFKPRKKQAKKDLEEGKK